MSRIHLPSTAEQHALFASQAAEDWLFAYTNAQHSATREAMWPHLVEAVETLITEARQLCARQTTEQK
ncbi:MAG: hypothetical protein HQL90_15835 [Magnetococcales bacterium]|nr:hypothetical protein [Magnetococcales bacterium]